MEPKDMKEDSGRVRTTSECSAGSSEDGHSEKRMRRFLVSNSLTSASPPKFVSLEEIMQAANGMRDMALVHQIVVDQNFKLTAAGPEADSFEKRVKDTMHRAFWDLLQSDIKEDPPKYGQALTLLEDIKEKLFSLLLPQHTKIKLQISEVLDSDLIKQQVEAGVLDFPHYAQYIISTMAKLCAPVRDERINQLTQMTEIVDIFKGILETLDLMQLDMANFTLELSKPDIIAHSVELERKKFADYLAIQTDGLEHTRKWLQKYLKQLPLQQPPETDYMTHVKSVTKQALCNGCVALLEWDENAPYPETFMLDEERLKTLQGVAFQVVIMGTILLSTMSSVSSNLQSLQEFKTSLKNNLEILLQPVSNDKELKDVLPNVAEQIVVLVKGASADCDSPIPNDQAEKILRQQILDVQDSHNKIRQLVWLRVREFYLQIILSSTAAPQKVPSGLTSFQKELTTIAGQFLRIVSHNHTVFSEYYIDIVSDTLKEIKANDK